MRPFFGDTSAQQVRAGIIAFASVATVFICPSHAMATTVLALSESEQVQRADVVALGVVTHNDVVKRDGMIITRPAFAVHKGLKGAHDGDTLVIEVPGGQIGNLVTSVSGAPRLSVGDMLVGFFEAGPEGIRPIGLSYGVIHIHGDWHTSKSIENLQLLRAPGPNTQMGMVSPDGESASVLLRRLQQTVASQAKGAP